MTAEAIPLNPAARVQSRAGGTPMEFSARGTRSVHARPHAARVALHKGYALISVRYAPLRFSGFARARQRAFKTEAVSQPVSERARQPASQSQRSHSPRNERQRRCSLAGAPSCPGIPVRPDTHDQWICDHCPPKMDRGSRGKSE